MNKRTTTTTTKWLRQAVQKQYYEMTEFVGFQTMGILVPYGITFDAVGVFGLAFHLLFKSCSTYCASLMLEICLVHTGFQYCGFSSQSQKCNV